jgi:alkylation response protein AidB-like acyl-CoA dehydrogenase
MSESLWEESEDIRELRNLVREWGVKEIRPRFRELEEKGEFPREIYRRMGAPEAATARSLPWPRSSHGCTRH